MKSLIRSRQGCWTCRLRKKKCDERQPLCSTCEWLSITCYGYGPRPEWMDGGPQEKAVVHELKQIVKSTSRRKQGFILGRDRDGRGGRELAPRGQGSPGAPPSGAGSETPNAESSEGTTPVGAGGSSFRAVSAEESTLLMNFLDEIFPLQYPVYKPDILEGGRGWLLHLLLRTKPLYHAALALSSYHLMISGFSTISPKCRVFSVVKKEERLAMCLEEVQRTIRDVQVFTKERTHNALGLLASVVQLVFFELFADDRSAWMIHLDAAVDMFRKGRRDELLHCGLSQKSKTLIQHGMPLGHFDPADDGATIVQEVVTFRFMEATIIWLDLIASITSGVSPTLLQVHSHTFRPHSPTKLEKIVGCPNWLVIHIGQTADLHARMADAQRLGMETESTRTRFLQEYDSIRDKIQSGLVDTRKSPTSGLSAPIPAMVFPHMAVIYLHLVVHGFQDLDRLGGVISEAMQILQNEVPCNLLSAMIAPLFIIGCVARQDWEQGYIRTVLSSAPVIQPLLKHRSRVLPALENVWIGRQTPGFTWSDAIRACGDLLLT
ncbi:fungal-specific transcription factor domain-containing protein [Aspergillus insuetus]